MSNENKNPHVAMLDIVAFAEGVQLAKFHAKVFRTVRETTNGKHLPEPLIVETVAESMTQCIFNSESPLTEEQKRTYIRAAFRTLTTDILGKNPDLLTAPLDNSEKEKEKEMAKKYYRAKESDDGKRAD